MTTNSALSRTVGPASLVAAAAAIAWAVGGGLDSTMGIGGVVINGPDANGNRTNNFLAAAVQADHRIVVVGADARTGTNKWAVRRYLENGSLDTSFGTAGLVALFGAVNNYDFASDVAIDASGKVYVAGIVGRVASQTKKTTTYAWDMAAVRLNADGSLDTTWGVAGKAIVPVSPGAGANVKLALQADGKLLLAGKDVSGTAVGAVARLTSSGALDATYATSGKLVYSGVNEILAVGLDPSGRLVAAGRKDDGTTWGQHCVVRFSAAGAVDATFPKRVVNNDFAAIVAQARVRDLAVQTDGAVLVSGWGVFGSQYDAMLVRYGANGQVDASFGTGGLVSTGMAGTYPRGLAIRQDGKILLAALNAPSGSPQTQTVLRFLASGALDSSFGTNGMADNALFDSTVASLNIYEMALDPDGRIVLAGTGSRPPSPQQIQGGALVRYLGD